MKIELVYFEGCPNADAARGNLRKACDELGLKADWLEWNQNDNKVPAHVKAFGSPSILVDGRDVAGGSADYCGEKSCRLYGGSQNAPAVETIKSALQRSLRP